MVDTPNGDNPLCLGRGSFRRLHLLLPIPVSEVQGQGRGTSSAGQTGAQLDLYLVRRGNGGLRAVGNALITRAPIFWPEAVALEFFAVSWLVKGRADRTAAAAGRRTLHYGRHPGQLVGE